MAFFCHPVFVLAKEIKEKVININSLCYDIFIIFNEQ